MVDRADLSRVSQLDGEARMINAGLESFDRGGVIVGLMVTPGPPRPEDDEMGMPPMMQGMQVPVAGMAYPQQMVDTIKNGLRQRLTEIEQEMQRLGVTSGAATAAMPHAPPPVTPRRH